MQGRQHGLQRKWWGVSQGAMARARLELVTETELTNLLSNRE